MLSKSTGPVEFADVNLESAIRRAFEHLGRPLPKVVEARHLAGTGFTRLDASHCNIECLDGLEHCTDLRYLELSYNRITDLTPLSKLTLLEDLFLGVGDFEAAPGSIFCTEAEAFLHTNRVVDLTPLENLSRLQYLDLAGNNELEDIGILSCFENLTWLVLGRNRISDFSVLASMPWLENFASMHANMDDDDLAHLSGCKRLLRLGIAHNNITHLGPLRDFHRLYALLAQYNRIRDISALEGLRNLTGIFLQGNEIEDLGPLARNPGLRGNDAINVERNRVSPENASIHVPVIQNRLGPHAMFLHGNLFGDTAALNISVEGPGETYPYSGTTRFPTGSPVTLIAMPQAGTGMAFAGWDKSLPDAASAVANFLLNADTEIRAKFAPCDGPTLRVNTEGKGSGKVFPGTGGPFTYRTGDVALLIAQPFPRSFFAGWSGDVTSTAPVLPVPMNGDTEITAHFSLRGHVLTVSCSEGGHVNPGAASYSLAEGLRIQLRASPLPGWAFEHWEGDFGRVNPQEPDLELCMTHSREVRAHFQPL